MLFLSEFSSELLSQVVNESLHNCINGFVIESLCLILQDEVDSIALLALGQVLAFIDVEEFDCFEQFLLGLIADAFHLCERHSRVEQQGKVATYCLSRCM